LQPVACKHEQALSGRIPGLNGSKQERAQPSNGRLKAA
jgi:hypothetical protein